MENKNYIIVNDLKTEFKYNIHSCSWTNNINHAELRTYRQSLNAVQEIFGHSTVKTKLRIVNIRKEKLYNLKKINNEKI